MMDRKGRKPAPLLEGVFYMRLYDAKSLVKVRQVWILKRTLWANNPLFSNPTNCHHVY